MKPIYRKLLWLVVVLAIYHVMTCFLTLPPGRIYHLEGWRIPPFYAISIVALLNWALLFPALP